MTSQEFKQTAKTVCTNFQEHARAMESDIKMLIQSLLDVIDSKIIALKKLLKLRANIQNVTNIAALAKLDEASMQENNDSLEDLSSIVYEADQNSLPRDDTRKRKCMADIAELKSFCLALDPNKHQDPKKALEKYIYHLSDMKSQQIGDQHSEKKSSLVYLGKADYESVLNILSMVLRSYEIQEEQGFKGGKGANNNLEERSGRKIASDSVCLGARKLKNNKKHSCSG